MIAAGTMDLQRVGGKGGPKMASAAHPVLPFNVSRSRTIRFPYMSFAPRIRCSIAEGPTIPSSRAFGSSETADCVIVGGGISGLCVAQALATKHAGIAPKVIVTEARDRVGGNITTIERDGYLREEGPNSFQPSDPILTMVVDSGLMDDLVLGDPNAPRFVLWDGKLRPVPARPTDLPIFDLMITGGKLRAGFGALWTSSCPSSDRGMRSQWRSLC
ncbi:hypothetical protein MLD38_015738 [Melastoma candidum]|uniref:Uncharacterized protein n=1 Tax=Melastoma candidum TaxID=119954 RepID=A0ACB9RKS8_9MYRT|nr:hypothetical protein MLD38_015738 [Melastoma candidum]